MAVKPPLSPLIPTGCSTQPIMQLNMPQSATQPAERFYGSLDIIVYVREGYRSRRHVLNSSFPQR